MRIDLTEPFVGMALRRMVFWRCGQKVHGRLRNGLFNISPGIAFKDSLSNVSLLSVPTIVTIAIVN